MPGVASVAAKGWPASRLARAIKPASAQRSDKPKPGQTLTITSKLPVLELILEIKLIAGAANVIAGAGDIHAIGGER